MVLKLFKGLLPNCLTMIIIMHFNLIDLVQMN